MARGRPGQSQEFRASSKSPASHRGPNTQPSSAAFTGQKQGTGSEVEQPGHELVSIHMGCQRCIGKLDMPLHNIGPRGLELGRPGTHLSL